MKTLVLLVSAIFTAFVVHIDDVSGCGHCGPGPTPRRSEWNKWSKCKNSAYKYRRRGNEKESLDCNECVNSNGNCDHICINTVGSYKCSCSKGYQAFGKKCKIRRCSPRGKPTNGRVVGCNEEYRGFCEMACNTGYKLHGVARSQCVMSASKVYWSDPRPSCQVKSCPKLTVKNGAFQSDRCKNNPTHGQVCNIACKDGYEYRGTPKSPTCNDGFWSNNIIVCQDTQPPEFDILCPLNITVVARGGQNSASVNWKRVTAKDNSGNVEVTPKNIKQPQMMMEGRHTFRYKAEDAEKNQKFCDVIINVKVLRCPPLYPPLNGKLVNPKCGNLYESKCHVMCDQGFTLKGENVRKCERNGIDMYWTGNPKCEVNTCPSFPAPANTTLAGYGCDGRVANYSTTCFVSCNIGFTELQGSRRRTCLANGNWSGSQLSCSAVSCPKLSINLGALTVEPNSCTDGNISYATVCRFTCKEGYQLVGPGLKTCTQSGTMSPLQNPFCKDVAPPKFLSCPRTIEATAAKEELTAKVEWARPNVTDNSGIPPNVTIKGKKSGSFLNEGEHSVIYTAADNMGNFASCFVRIFVSVIRCWPKVFSPPGGKMICSSSNIYGSKCVFSCHRGYNLEGSVYRVCEKNGTKGYWSGNETKCKLAKCPHIELPPNTLQSGCGGGKVQNIFGDKCFLYCRRGFYKESGSSERICQANGTWSGEPMHCREVKCPPLHPPAHGYVEPNDCTFSPKYGVSCYFSCKKGFRPVGTLLRFCLSNGIWSSNSSIVCKDIESPSFGSTCPTGILATADKGKNYTEPSWPPVVATDNSGIKPVVTTVGIRAKYYEGKHLIVYNATDSAENRKLCRFYLSVDVTRCRRLLSPINGFFFGPCDNIYGSKCTMGCDNGYRLDGSSSTTCVAKPGHLTGRWDQDFPVCRVRRCTKLNLPQFGIVYPFMCTISPVSGTECYFECKHGYKLEGGVEQVHCGLDGKWDVGDDPSFKCKDITRPVFESCPLDIAIGLEEGGRADANWTIPVVSDNSRTDPKVTVSPKGIHPPYSFHQTTKVIYTAMDSSGNVAKCSFKITVEDNEGPKVVYCPPNQEIKATGWVTTVKWKQPKFKDNSNEPLIIRCSHNGSADFYWGTWNVHCTAYDKNPSNKPAICKFTLNVKPLECPKKKPPKNGAMACDNWVFGQFCSPFCNDQWDFLEDFRESTWFCTGSGMWWPRRHWPDCSKAAQPNKARRKGELHYYTGYCTNPETRSQIKEQFIKILNSTVQINRVCREKAFRDKCKAENVKVTCSLVDIKANRNKREAAVDDMSLRRVPRAVSVAKITFEIAVYLGDVVTDDTKESKIKLGDTGVQITQNISSQIVEVLDKENIPITLHGKKFLPDKKSLNFSEPEKQCSEGQTFRNGFCLNCTSGTYLDKGTGRCNDCPVGTYQEKDAQIGCVQCPNGTSTTESRTDNSSSCLALCRAGTFSPTGLEPCMKCEKGFYQEEDGQTVCKRCIEGRTTSSEGSDSSAECGVACSAGSFSNNGLEPCILCDRRSYQPHKETRSCLFCPGTTETRKNGSRSSQDCVEINECDSSPCINNSTCKGLVADYLCLCPLGLAGKNCEINIDDCQYEPCLNNGTCHDLLNGFSCSCPQGFEGANCEHDIDECKLSPCVPDSKCNNIPGSFTCICETGFTGVLCDVEINECDTSPCLNDATCRKKSRGYECICPRGFQGINCEDKLEACASLPCQNGGKCIDSTNSYQCNCSDGFKGRQCEINIDDCAESPCMNNSTCIDGVNGFYCRCDNGLTGKTCELKINDCLLEVCKNDGICIATDDGFRCQCRAGFDGLNCENNIDDCASNPCSNNAICHDEVNNFTCRCPPGYTGKDCNIDINECQGKPCLNNGICSDYINSFSCQCKDGFEGSLCEIDVDDCKNSPCLNKGICTDRVNDYTCECPFGFTGINCEIELDECSSNPCLHEGTCVDLLGRYECACIDGYTGGDCAYDRDDCLSSPCFNSGTCIDKLNGYLCECPDGFVGSRCEKDVIDCFEDVCLNGGICRDGINTYSCDCPSGFFGQHCEFEIDECDSFPCLFGGSCHDKVNGYVCICLNGFTGINCEENIDDCKLSPCLNNGTCIDEVANYSCYCPDGFAGLNCEILIDFCEEAICTNDGTCINSPKGFECECRNGYFGERCELVVDECWTQPCLNDATCVSNGRNFTCLCPGGFTGKLCEVDIDECASSPCKNAAICTDVIDGFTCICNEGYNGTLCENDIDECKLNPCLNNGTCHNLTPGYKCNCGELIGGKICDKELDLCESSPCRNGGNCTIDHSNRTFKCICRPGFTGRQCEHDIDDCRGVSCFQNSYCIDLVNNYTCECLPSYTGDHCDILLGSNFDLIFKRKTPNDMVLLPDNNRIPSMARFTIAMFLKADSKVKSGTLFGYSVEDDTKEKIVLYYSASQLHMKVKEKTISADCALADDQWHFVGGVWDGETGVASLYLDGRELKKQYNILKGMLMPGGGWMSLGKFYFAAQKRADTSSFFSGTLHQVNLWSTAATADHMWLAAQNCSWPIPGSTRGWTDFLFGIKGAVEKKFKSDCKAIKTTTRGTSYHFARCESRNARYYCICEAGFTGDHCKINIDDCATNPCVHGRCVDGVNQYECVCQHGYWGKHCERKLSIEKACPRIGNPFKGSKICKKAGGEALCTLECDEGNSFDLKATARLTCGPDTRWKWNGKSKLKLPLCSTIISPGIISHRFSVLFYGIVCHRSPYPRGVIRAIQLVVRKSLSSIPGCSFADECKTYAVSSSACGDVINALKVQFSVSIQKSRSTLVATVEETSEAAKFQLEYDVSTGNFSIEIYGLSITADKSSLKHLSTTFTCLPGSVVGKDTKSCVKCPVGTFHNQKTHECEPCGLNSYQDKEGQTSCLLYPGFGKK